MSQLPDRPNSDSSGSADQAPQQLLKEFLEKNPEVLRVLLEKPSFGKLLGVFWRGPLPPPEVLEGYDQVVPGAARGIFDQFEKQSEHRRRLEERLLTHLERRDHKALNIVLVIALASVLGSIWLIFTGKSVEGLLTFGSTLTSLLVSYIQGSQQSAKERREKREMLERLDRGEPLEKGSSRGEPGEKK
ncbi:hypothetical protein AN926_06020 [Thermus scotoductus]|uniref:DUF2335 domain-containing protein n=1 Tax=Thermus scotoductus TaxID=37636 RepID=A0A0N0ZQV8_THESC|nr:hypothetical protein AN926_06020 [Thermus scotoductus]